MSLFNLFKRPEKTKEAVKRSKQGWFSNVLGVFSRSNIDEALWNDLEELLISADTGMPTTTKLMNSLRERAKQEKIKDGIGLKAALKREMAKVLKSGAPGLTPAPQGPTAILVVGVNGVGKTTSIAKLAEYFRSQGQKVVLAAGDTFRAAAIEQLQAWGKRTGSDVIAHQHGSDPGAVVFDAMNAAKSRGADVLIIDTAGRLHTKFNLMEELKKIRRVIQKVDPTAPHATLLVIDATTGQNGLTQARTFKDAADISGIFLTKLDGTAKGGIVLSIIQELGLPIMFIGTGEKMDDIAPFDADDFLDSLFDEEEG
ncbi:MAG: signal recognition particle-docking protein FtsY [Dehalococcoidia bacterium]|nr:signal recognition particle-docking protein FtsY [Dehalococcoidia bacterium]